MLSRVADSLYWMSRYLERAEHTARVINVQLNLMLERGSAAPPTAAGRACWRSLGHPQDRSAENERSVHSRRRPTHLRIDRRRHRVGARERPPGARTDQLGNVGAAEPPVPRSAGAWNRPDVWTSQPLDFLQSIKEGAHLFQGITDSTMTHGEGWQFIQVGRFIERAAAIARLLDIAFPRVSPAGASRWTRREHLEWIGLLRTCTAFEAYCKVYTADLQPERIAEFLVLNTEFPHSVRFARGALRRSLEAINRPRPASGAARGQASPDACSAALSFTPIDEIMSELARVLRRHPAPVRAASTPRMYEVYITYPIEAALTRPECSIPSAI